MEAVTPLASVGSGVGVDLNTPLNTFDVGQGCRVGAVLGIGVQSWVSLIIDVEGDATVLLIAVRGTANGIVARHCLISKI